MNIKEAVQLAIMLNKCITLEEVYGVKIKPTNGIENCIVMNADGSNPSKHGWQPSAEQLMSEHWIIVD